MLNTNWYSILDNTVLSLLNHLYLYDISVFWVLCCRFYVKFYMKQSSIMETVGHWANKPLVLSMLLCYPCDTGTGLTKMLTLGLNDKLLFNALDQCSW